MFIPGEKMKNGCLTSSSQIKRFFFIFSQFVHLFGYKIHIKRPEIFLKIKKSKYKQVQKPNKKIKLNIKNNRKNKKIIKFI